MQNGQKRNARRRDRLDGRRPAADVEVLEESMMTETLSTPKKPTAWLWPLAILGILALLALAAFGALTAWRWLLGGG